DHHSRLNFKVIAVLKGSTSAYCSAAVMDSREIPNSTNKMMYLIAQSRSCTANGNSYWGMLILRAISLMISCKAPNGHNQPQNPPRPHSNILAAVKPHRIKITGSLKNSCQLKSCIIDWVKVSTLTIDNCPRAYQPINTTVKVK